MNKTVNQKVQEKSPLSGIAQRVWELGWGSAVHMLLEDELRRVVRLFHEADFERSGYVIQAVRVDESLQP